MKKGVREKRRTDKESSVEIIQPAPADEQLLALSESAGKKKYPKQTTKFLAKEILDRIGYGLSSQQFINILFILIGANYFIIGTINGLKMVLGVIISFILEKYAIAKGVSKKLMKFSAILFAFSVFLLTLAIGLQSLALFITAILLGGILAILYGNLYQDWFKENLEMEFRGHFLQKISYYGLLITGASMLAGAYLADNFLSEGKSIPFNLLNFKFDLNIRGYSIAFAIAAVLFLISAIIIFLIKDKPKIKAESEKSKELSILSAGVRAKLFGDKVIVILLVTSSLVSICQTLGASYYGIFIYQQFNNTGYGGFTNVAIIFLIALLTSVVGPVVTQYNSRAYGKFPMLVFGTLLMAIMPLTFYYNPTLLAIALATFLSTIGASICGVAYGMLIGELIHEDYKKPFVKLSGVLTILPYLIFVPLGAYFAQEMELPLFFLLLGLILAIAVMPLYFLIILMYNLRKEKI